MPSIAFCVPVHPLRVRLAAICLRQLRRTCDALIDEGVMASAVVVSDRETIDELDPLGLGFATVERDNYFLGRRYNDAIQLATDPAHNSNPADYVVPFGSDDWADYRLFLEPLPAQNEIQGFQQVCFVSEDGRSLSTTFLGYEGGCGIRIIPRQLVAPLGYRPADEDRPRGCDTSILANLRRYHAGALKIKHLHLHDRQIVDWKSAEGQLNSYPVVTSHRSTEIPEPFDALADLYPESALDEMREHYGVAYV